MAVSSSERKQIWMLYERYGYRTSELDDDYMIFVLENVMYPAVDILIFDEASEKHLPKKSEYSAKGYGVRVTVYHGLPSIEDYPDVYTQQYYLRLKKVLGAGLALRWTKAGSRVSARTPVQWTAGENAGFSPPGAAPWQRWLPRSSPPRTFPPAMRTPRSAWRRFPPTSRAAACAGRGRNFRRNSS